MQSRGTLPSVEGVAVTGDVTPAYAEILTADALAFVAKLARAFEGRRQELLAAAGGAAGGDRRRDDCRTSCRRRARCARATGRLRPVPADLQDRRVEITGPVDRKMIINALNCGAKVFMADFEDANSPTWANNIEGQINLRDAIDKHHHLRQPGRADLPPERDDRDADGAPARLAPAREARPDRRRADLRQPLRLRPLLLPQRQPTARATAPARTSTCRRWRAISRRGSGTTSS